jgi:hypothetical protein
MSLVISLTALFLSAFVFLHNRWASKRDLLLKIHEQLLASDRQHGRRVLFELLERGGKVTDLSAGDFLAVNHALASLDLMSFLFVKRYIPRADAIALWGLTGTRLFRAAMETDFLALRDKQHGADIWPYLRQFVEYVDQKQS